MWKHYFIVTSIDEALNRLAANLGHARLIAGGTDLLIEIERGQRPSIDTLIDISRIPDLNTITLDNGLIRLGALVTHNQIVGSDLIQWHGLPLAQACWEVGAPQIRNRGTLAGNVITGSPANDTITPLWALDAQVTLQSREAVRTILLRDFYTGVRRTVIRPDELLTAITFPALTDDQHGMFIKLGLRKAQAISVVNVAALITLHEDRSVQAASITLGCVAPTIIRVPEAEAVLIGQLLTPEIIAEAGRLTAESIHPIDDIRSPAAYRRQMADVLVRRALRTIATGETRKSWPIDPPLLSGHAEHDSHMNSSPYADDQPIRTTINGVPRTIATGQDKTLLRFLREDAHLPGTKEGCAEGECGACTIFLDGAAVMACMIPAPRAHGSQVVTIEGLAAPDGTLHPLQQSFITAGAVQCGYCTPGFIMSGAKLLEEHPQPTRDQVVQSITGNLCRCTGYYTIIEAIQNARKANVEHASTQSA